MTISELTETVVRLTERIELLEKLMRGVREEVQVILEDQPMDATKVISAGEGYGLGHRYSLIEVRA